MGSCNIDHSHEDVIQKLKNQQDFLPEHVAEKLHLFLANDRSQPILNELFHLLKKYDLVSNEEREERNQKFLQLIN